MTKKIFSLLLFLLAITLHAQKNFEQGGAKTTTKYFGALTSENVFAVPLGTHDSILPAARYAGRFQFNTVTNRPEMNDGDSWVNFLTENDLAQPNGVARLDGGGKIPVSYLPNSIMTLEGQWNAFTNTPTIVNGVGRPGMVYEVSEAGSQTFGSENIHFNKGDFAVYGNNGHWYKSINSNDVFSVAGKTGVVTLTKSDVSLSMVNNTSDESKPVSIATNAALAQKANIDGTNVTGVWPVDISGNTNKVGGLNAGNISNVLGFVPAAIVGTGGDGSLYQYNSSAIGNFIGINEKANKNGGNIFNGAQTFNDDINIKDGKSLSFDGGFYGVYFDFLKKFYLKDSGSGNNILVIDKLTGQISLSGPLSVNGQLSFTNGGNPFAIESTTGSGVSDGFRIVKQGVDMVFNIDNYLTPHFYRRVTGVPAVGSDELVVKSQLDELAATINILTAKSPLNFPSTEPSSFSDLTLSVPGAIIGDVVSLGIPITAVKPVSVYSAWVSAPDVVTVRFNNYGATVSQNPDSGLFNVKIIK